MAMWRCPHCGTPQAEAARCWVCRRSSTSCGTCRHFRRSVAIGVGYCGLDARRAPLQGSEIEPCWEAAEAVPLAVPVRLAAPGAIGPAASTAESEPAASRFVATAPSAGGLWSESEL